jgi:hypothetical protein
MPLKPVLGRVITIITLWVVASPFVGCESREKDWVTYRSSGYGFTLKHPKQWRPYETAFENSLWSISSFNVSDGREIHFSPNLVRNATLESIKPLLKSGKQNAADDYRDPVVISEWKNISLGPNKGYTASVTRPTDSVKTIFVLKVGRKVYAMMIPKEFDNDTTRAIIASMRDKSK